MEARLSAHAAESPGGLGGRHDVDSPTSAVVGAWWTAHFGAGSADVVPFDRMRIAAEAELGALSSVDVQLLRLELSDERGKLTKTVSFTHAHAHTGGQSAPLAPALLGAPHLQHARLLPCFHLGPHQRMSDSAC